MLPLAAAPVVGFAIGIAAAVLGIGGGVLLVPLLHLALGLEMHRAVGTSLLIILFTALSASIAYLRRGLVLARVAALMEPGSMLGVFVGASLSHSLDPRLLRACFAPVLLYVAARMWARERRSRRALSLRTPPYILVAVGVLAGFLSGLLGIGGGIVKVPAMSILMGIPIHSAVATSELMIVATAMAGVVVHSSAGYVDYLIAALIAPFTVMGSQVGARLAVRLRAAVVSRTFSVLLALIAARMLLPG